MTRMKIFDTDVFDISEAGHPVMVDLCDLLREAMSERSTEEAEIRRAYEGVYDTLRSSLNQEQRTLFDKYQDQVEAETGLFEHQQFVCGFKTAFRLALESLK